ncbi:MAG: DUF502 domain-containing protein [Chthoniobacterales bacterium]
MTSNRPLRAALNKLGNTLLAGVAVAVPLIVTILLLRMAYLAVNNVTAPIFKTLGIHWPGIGFVSTLVLVMLLGVMARNVLGRKVIEFIDSIFLNVPIISQVYGGVKQALESFKSLKTKKSFKSVAYVEYPSEGCRLIGFVTGTLNDPLLGQEMTTVFLPTSPNPLTGFVVAIPNDKIIESSLTLEQASKVIVSAGLVAPGFDDKTPLPDTKLGKNIVIPN